MKAVAICASVACGVVLLTSAGLIGLSVAALKGTLASHPKMDVVAVGSRVVVLL